MRLNQIYLTHNPYVIIYDFYENYFPLFSGKFIRIPCKFMMRKVHDITVTTDGVVTINLLD